MGGLESISSENIDRDIRDIVRKRAANKFEKKAKALKAKLARGKGRNKGAGPVSPTAGGNSGAAAGSSNSTIIDASSTAYSNNTSDMVCIISFTKYCIRQSKLKCVRKKKCVMAIYSWTCALGATDSA